MYTAQTGKTGFITIFLITAVLAVFSAIVLRPLQKLLFERLEAGRDSFIALGEDFLGREIKYRSVSPSFAGSLNIKGIRIGAADEKPLLSIERLRISFSLAELLFGNRDPLESLRGIRMERPLINFDTEADRDLLQRFSALRTDPESSIKELLHSFPEKFKIRVRRGSFAFKKAEDYVHAADLALDLSFKNGAVLMFGKLKAGAELHSLSGPDLKNMAGLSMVSGLPDLEFLSKPMLFSMSAKIKGSLSPDFSTGNGRIILSSFSGGFFRLRPMGLDLSLENQNIVITRMKDRHPIDFLLTFGMETGLASLHLENRNLLLKDLFSLEGNLKNYNHFLSVSANGSLDLHAGPDILDYRIDMQAHIREPGPFGIQTLAIRADGDRDRVRIDNAELDIRQGGASFQGVLAFTPLSPNGTIRFRNFGLSGISGLNGDIAVTTLGREINFFSDTISSGSVELTALDTQLNLGDSGFSFAASALRFTGIESYEEEVTISNISLSGVYDQGSGMEASLYLDSFSVGDLVEMSSPFTVLPELPRTLQPVVEDVSITAEVFVTTDFEYLLYNAPRIAIAYIGPFPSSGLNDIVALVSVSGTNQRFSLNEGQVIWPGGRLEMNGDADFSQPQDITFFLMSTWQDLPYYFNGTILDKNSLSLLGSYGLELYISSAGTGYSGYLEAKEVPFTFRNQVAALSVSSSFRYDDALFWSVTLDRLTITNLNTPASPFTNINISGYMNQNGALVSRLTFDDGRGSLSGNAACTWFDGFRNLQFSFRMADTQGLEELSLEGTFMDQELDLTLLGRGLKLGRVLENTGDGVLDATLSLRWRSIDAFRAEILLSSLSARIQDTDLTATGTAFLDNREISLEGLSFNYGAFNAQLPSVIINREEGRAEARAFLQGAAAGRTFDVSLYMDAEGRPISSWFRLGEALKVFEGNLRVDSFRYDAIEAEEAFNFAFSRTPDEAGHSVISVNGGPKNMLRLELNEEGDFYAGLSKPSPIRGSVFGKVSPSAIDAQAPDLYVDLPGIWRFVPPDQGLVLSGGYVRAQVAIRGPLGDPEFFGTARGNSVRIQVPKFLTEDIRPAPVDVRIEGSEISFGPLGATVGRGGGTITGWFRFDRWIPNIFSMDIDVASGTPIPFGFDISGFLAHGDASGNLNLSMEDMILTVSGVLTAQNSEISLDVNEINNAAFSDPYADLLFPVLVDLNVTTGNKVEFVWPNADFPILHAYADQGTMVEVSSDSISRRFSINSDVKLRSGEIFYFERSFYIREGSLSFRENEVQFNPRINARAEIRDRTNDGPVTISLIVDNAPLLSFTARLESSPALSQMEIFSLLGQNIAGSNIDENTGAVQRAFLNSSADILAQFQVVRRIERLTRDFLHLDMFSIRTQFIQNALFDATGIFDYTVPRGYSSRYPMVSGNYQEPVDRNSAVGNYFDNTTVFLGKYIGKGMFIQSMLSLRYDAYPENLGGFRIGENLSIEPDISIELDGPIFDIRWNFVPLHPENLFVNDSFFSLIWSWSF
ncbi:MAG: translocation/assembly module TamB domain-containing protein [Treponema sp.]|nr:translocation/assembly module TamB domain-containing protein [Treponema sp.]